MVNPSQMAIGGEVEVLYEGIAPLLGLRRPKKCNRHEKTSRKESEFALFHICLSIADNRVNCRILAPSSADPPTNGDTSAVAPAVIEPLPDLELTLPPSPPPIEDVLAARRAKRAAILAKYQSQQSTTSSTSDINALAPTKIEVDETPSGAQSTAPVSGLNSAVQKSDDVSDGKCLLDIESKP